MYPRSAAFDAAVQASHVVGFKAEIYDNNVLQRTLDITDGNVSVADEPVRRRATLTLSDDEDGTLTPSEASDLLAPYGNEIKLYRGIQFAAGTEELLPLGVFVLDDITITDSGPGLTIQVDTYDRAMRVEQARLVNDYVVAQGANYVTAIEDLIRFRYPRVTFRSVPTNELTPSLFFTTEADPWEQARKMADAIGYDLYFDVEGVCVLEPVVNPVFAQPVWTYKEGQDATFLSLQKRMNREGTYNHVVVTGENTDNATPVRAEAKDDNPTSPTYYLGDFGDVPLFHTSEFITTTAQAQAAATARLAKELGAMEEVRFNSIVHPAHEIGDVIKIERAKSRINAIYIIDQLSIPMTVDRAMDVGVRTRIV